MLGIIGAMQEEVELLLEGLQDAGKTEYPGVTLHTGRLDGLELRTTAWRIEAADIRHVRSSFFDDRDAFRAGTIHLDSALVMRDVAVEWHSVGSLSPRHNHSSPAPA